MQNPNITLKDILQNIKFCEESIINNLFLWNDVVYKNNLKKDIKTRKEKIKSLAMFNSLEELVAKYVGYL